MSHRLPVFINPEHACNRGLICSGSLDLEKMQRLRDRLSAPYGTVNIELTFYKEGRGNKLEGSISGNMVAECQRCMQAMPIEVNHAFKLAFITSEAEIETLMPGEEPCMANEGDLLLADIIEDELELSLPMIVMHDNEQCGEKTNESEDARESDSQKQNPFAVLSELKDKVT